MLLYGVTCAQQAEFSQFYAAPLHLNSALAGVSHGPRVGLIYRNQWPELGDGPNGGFVTYGVSYDQHIEKLKGGLGIQLLQDRIANSILVENTISAMYSYQIRSRNKKLGVKIGVGGTYRNRYVDWYELLLLDQADPVQGFFDVNGNAFPINEPIPSSTNRHIFNANTGIVVFNHRFYAGAAANNLIPEKGFYDETVNNYRIAIHGGGVIPLGNKRRYERKWYVSPNILYVTQNNFHQITVGSLVGYDFIYTGIWLRHTINNFDAVISGIGFKKGFMRFGYSFDINVSPLKGSAGSHELSVTLNFTKEKNSLYPSYIQGYTPCPIIFDF